MRTNSSALNTTKVAYHKEGVWRKSGLRNQDTVDAVLQNWINLEIFLFSLRGVENPLEYGV